MRIQAESVNHYLQQVPEDRRLVLEKLRQVITEHLPDRYEEKIQYDMITYVVPREKFPAGYHCNPEDDLAFISIASQKHHIAIYHNGIYLWDEIRDWFLEEYPKHLTTKPDVGKACIRFKNMKTIPYDLIGQLCQKVRMEAFIQHYQERQA